MKVEIDENDLGWLVHSAVRFNSRLPHGIVPERIWKLLSPQWQRIIKDEEDE